jgi:amidase
VAVAANMQQQQWEETSGSILSPSWQNSIIGLKPTTGLLSRSGIIPISSRYAWANDKKCY